MARPRIRPMLFVPSLLLAMTGGLVVMLGFFGRSPWQTPNAYILAATCAPITIFLLLRIGWDLFNPAYSKRETAGRVTCWLGVFVFAVDVLLFFITDDDDQKVIPAVLFAIGIGGMLLILCGDFLRNLDEYQHSNKLP